MPGSCLILLNARTVSGPRRFGSIAVICAVVVALATPVLLPATATAAEECRAGVSTTADHQDPSTCFNESDGEGTVTGAADTVEGSEGSDTIGDSTGGDSDPSDGSDSGEAGNVDQTPPRIIWTITGTLGQNDWYVSNVEVKWTIDEPESTVTETEGCEEDPIVQDTPLTLTCKATSGGGTASVDVDVRRDTTAPTVTVTGVQNGATYPTTNPPTAGCDTQDATSGVAVHATLTSTPTPGPNGITTITVTCAGATDNAGHPGNTATATYTLAPPAPPAPPAWNAGTIYQAGDKVSYQGKIYLASWWTRGEQPGKSATGAWQEIATDTTGMPVWTPSRIFNTGDKVSYQGKIYLATWWTRGEQPGKSATGAWQEIATDANNMAIWTPSRIFNTGEQVSYQGKTYRAKWWNRNQTPGPTWGPWEQLT